MTVLAVGSVLGQSCDAACAGVPVTFFAAIHDFSLWNISIADVTSIVWHRCSVFPQWMKFGTYLRTPVIIFLSSNILDFHLFISLLFLHCFNLLSFLFNLLKHFLIFLSLLWERIFLLFLFFFTLLCNLSDLCLSIGFFLRNLFTFLGVFWFLLLLWWLDDFKFLFLFFWNNLLGFQFLLLNERIPLLCFLLMLLDLFLFSFFFEFLTKFLCFFLLLFLFQFCLSLLLSSSLLLHLLLIVLLPPLL